MKPSEKTNRITAFKEKVAKEMYIRKANNATSTDADDETVQLDIYRQVVKNTLELGKTKKLNNDELETVNGMISDAFQEARRTQKEFRDLLYFKKDSKEKDSLWEDFKPVYVAIKMLMDKKRDTQEIAIEVYERLYELTEQMLKLIERLNDLEMSDEYWRLLGEKKNQEPEPERTEPEPKQEQEWEMER